MKMEKNKEIISIGLLIIILLSLNFVFAEMLTSDAGVEYESRILDEFVKLEGTDETFIPVIIELKDFSKANDLLSIFSADEIQDVAIRDLSKMIGIDLTEEAFFKLLKDDRVNKVSYDYPMYLSDEDSSIEKILIFILILGVFILFGTILFFIIKKVTKKNVNNSFAYLILVEVFFGIILYFIPFSWKSPCTTPNFFHPLGREMTSGVGCIQVFTKTIFPLFYFLVYLLIITLIIYGVYILINKVKKK